MQIPKFEKARILVVGDIFLDRYWFGNTERISPEAPVPIVHIQNCEERPGGAGNVAMNLAALGIKTTLLGVVGKDLDAQNLLSQLQTRNIRVSVQELSSIPTITKTRILSQQQQLIRLDREEFFYTLDQKNLEQEYLKLISDCDVVVLSDYHKGTLQDPQFFIQTAKKKNIPVLVDPKNKDFSIYAGADLLTPNRKEFETAMGSFFTEEDLFTKSALALKKYQLGALLITRGSEGMSLFQTNKPGVNLAARAYEVRDVTGAGDTVISTLAAALAAGDNLENATHLANIAAGLAVTKLGAVAITPSELRQHIHIQCSQAGILSEDQALLMRQEARQNGRRVIMTNGCFDILHPGHVEYLEAAKTLGDLLFIAVNNDDSVRRLKGEDRPYNNLQDRMTVLAALRSVDAVIPFSEDTPARLIQKISPDVLVKGIDYQGEFIAGADFVLAQGGEVKRIGPEKRWSSTEMVERVRGMGEG